MKSMKLMAVLFFSLAVSTQAGVVTQYVDQVVLEGITMGSWPTPAVPTVEAAYGGSYVSNAQVRYEVSAIKDSLRVPVSAAAICTSKLVQASFVVKWSKYADENADAMILLRSTDAGTNYTYRILSATAREFRDSGTSVGWYTNFTGAYSPVATATTPWSTPAEVTAAIAAAQTLVRSNVTATVSKQTTTPMFATTNAPTITVTPETTAITLSITPLYVDIGGTNVMTNVTIVVNGGSAVMTNATASCAGLTAGASVAIMTNATVSVIIP